MWTVAPWSVFSLKRMQSVPRYASCKSKQESAIKDMLRMGRADLTIADDCLEKMRVLLVY